MHTATIDVTESGLIARSLRGDQDAINELVRKNYPASLRVARSILRNQHDSEDAVQAAYSRAFRYLDTFQQNARFGTWITRIVVNQSIMSLRRQRRKRSLSLEELTAKRGTPGYLVSREPNPEDLARRDEMSTSMRRAVGRLPLPLREAYALHALADLPLKEVAARLGVSVPAAKTRMFRARTALRSLLQEQTCAPTERICA